MSQAEKNKDMRRLDRTIHRVKKFKKIYKGDDPNKSAKDFIRNSEKGNTTAADKKFQKKKKDNEIKIPKNSIFSAFQNFLRRKNSVVPALDLLDSEPPARQERIPGKRYRSGFNNSYSKHPSSLAQEDRKKRPGGLDVSIDDYW
jgi:hypothetical protein